MKKLYFLFFLLALAIQGFSQTNTMQDVNRYGRYGITKKIKKSSAVIRTAYGKTSSCGTDTVLYPLGKFTGIRYIEMNPTTSAAGAHQWYPAPQFITISGVQFYAIVPPSTGVASVTATCNIYAAGPDSMPTGFPLQSTTVVIDSFSANLQRTVLFPSPVTTNAAYVVSVETSASTSFILASNDYLTFPADGGGEWLSSATIGSTNLRSYMISVGGSVFDADWLMFPLVSYNLDADFTLPAVTCLGAGTPVTFTNTSSAANFSRFYNFRAATGTTANSFWWDYGNSTSGNAIDGSTTYSSSGPFTVSLTDTLQTWSIGSCVDVNTQLLSSAAPAPTASGGGTVCTGGTISLSASVVSGASYYWTGPNGFTSTSRTPSITGATVAMAGTYDVISIIGSCSSTVASVVVSIISQPVLSSNGPLCEGQTLTLTSSTFAGGATYSWTGPNGFTSSTQNPDRTGTTMADSGTYTVTVSAAGCGTLPPTDINVIIKPTPAPLTLSSNTPVCTGDALNLTATGAPVGAAFTWTGPNTFSSSVQNPVIAVTTATATGTYSATATLNGCTSTAATTAATITALPAAPVAGNNGPLCPGQTLSLTASLTPGATYTWSGPNSFSSTTQNPSRPSITTADAGTYSVYLTSGGCNSGTATTVVAVSSTAPAPTASANSPICEGQTLQLTASSISGATYSWTGPNGFSSSTQNPSIPGITTAEDGIYSVTATTVACGTSIAVNVPVSVNTMPSSLVAGNSGPVCEGENVGLSITTVSGATYTWTGPGGFSSSLQNPTLTAATPAKSGIYSVTVSKGACNSAPVNTTIKIIRKPAAPVLNTNSPVCEDDSITLSATSSSASSTAMYSWSGPNSFSSTNAQSKLLNVTTADGGLYTATVTDSGCVSAASQVSVTVKSKPAAPVPSSNSPVCEGGHLDLSATTISGAVYTWAGPSNYTSTSRVNSISPVTAAAAGNYSVTAIVSGCKSIPSSINVVIQPKPAAPAAGNNGPACVGSNAFLSAGFVTGGTYQWTGPAGFHSTEQNPSVLITSIAYAGQYNVAVTVSGCASDAGTTTLAVTPKPAKPVVSILPSKNLCAGDTLYLSAQSVAGAAYTWSGPNGFTASSANPSLNGVTPLMSGTYYASLILNACPSDTTSISDIVISPRPATSSIIGLTTVNRNDTSTYFVTNNTGNFYQWTAQNGTIISGNGSNTIKVKWQLAGVGSVTVQEANPSGCKGPEQHMDVSVGPTLGVYSANHFSNISVYPNPFSSYLTIEGNYVKNKSLSISITDVSGRTITTLDLPAGSYFEKQINTSSFDRGIYFIRLSDETGDRVYKVLKSE